MCMALFNCFMEEYHQVRFDNLYMSANFCLGSAQHPKKVMAEGVTRTSQRGLPQTIIQQEVKIRKYIAKVKGTVKAAVLDGCPLLADSPLVAASVYDQKGVHFLSTCVEKVDWIEKTREIWDKVSSSMRVGKFLRLSINYSYNMNMNNVDIADQLRGSYRPDRWMQNMKWWWSMFFWGHGTMLVNIFLTYKRFTEMKGKTPMSHYDFRVVPLCLQRSVRRTPAPSHNYCQFLYSVGTTVLPTVLQGVSGVLIWNQSLPEVQRAARQQRK